MGDVVEAAGDAGELVDGARGCFHCLPLVLVAIALPVAVVAWRLG